MLKLKLLFAKYLDWRNYQSAKNYGLWPISFEIVIIKENGTQMTGSIRGDWKLNDLNQLKLRKEQERVLIVSKDVEK